MLFTGYIMADVDTWVDFDGTERPCPRKGTKLRPWKSPLHAALRRYVFQRDGFTCVFCKATANEDVANYNGFRAVSVAGGAMRDSFGASLEMHHLVPASQGGSHHPSNLQTLCYRCHPCMEANPC